MAASPGAPALEDVSCNLCGSTARRTIVVENSFPICRCEGCGLLYVSPRPAVASSDYWRNRTEGVTKAPAFEPVKSLVFDHGLDALRSRAPGQGRLLDVGCGFGIFLERAQGRGWDPYGCDVSAAAVRYAQQERGLANVVCSDFAAVGYPPGRFQVATLWNVLDLVADPLATLREVARVLAPGGVAMVRVSNMAFHAAAWRIRPILPRRSRRFKYLAGVSPPTRLFGFNPRTLTALMEKAGFEAVEAEPALHYRNESARLVAVVETATRSVHRATGGRAIVSPTMVVFGRVARH